jgi:cytochrome c-type biogenesis protein CcmF
MNYIGEHLLPGQLGHFFTLLSLVASLVACIAYFRSANSERMDEALGWKKLARIAFVIDCISVFSVFGILYYIISAHLFEYFYAWNHSSLSLSSDYLLSCIWEGQEGSFLLWTVWHCVLGLILIFKARQWEAPVMTVISFAQFCLATMIIGIYIFDLKIGSNPFLLVRDHFQDAPIFKTADYLSLPQMKDGQGLNQLLQNYWMVIHPPVLFLGFASTIVPFAFAIAGLWKKNYGGWTKIAFPWTLFSACILGTGIIMGAAWAYESLTFGGYWAWDPVENASLVPYMFLILTFCFVLYSTYLTRSGDLQDTSVHAFTGAGMNWQLRIFLLAFFIPSIVLYIKRYKNIPAIVKEESSYSREFWMFIGALVFFLSGIFIIISTSLPVFNKIFNTKFALGDDVEFTYNRVQIFVAIVIGIITAVTQYLKYKDTSKNYFLKKIAVPTLIAIVIAACISLFGAIDYNKYGPGYLTAIHIAIFTAVYAVVANAGYIWLGLNGKIKAAGGSVAHMGFALMLVGILISSSKKEVLSKNTTGINLRFDPKSKENSMEHGNRYG